MTTRKEYVIDNWEFLEMDTKHYPQQYLIAKVLVEKGMCFDNQFEPSFTVTPRPSGNVTITQDVMRRTTTFTQELEHRGGGRVG